MEECLKATEDKSQWLWRKTELGWFFGYEGKFLQRGPCSSSTYRLSNLLLCGQGWEPDRPRGVWPTVPVPASALALENSRVWTTLRHEICGYSAWRESPPTNPSGCTSDLPQMISLQLQVIGVISRQVLLVEVSHDLGLDVMLMVPLYCSPWWWGLLMKAQLRAPLLWHAVVPQWGHEARSTVLPGILHLEVKTVLRTVAVGCFPLHTQTCKHRASIINTESSRA